MIISGPDKSFTRPLTFSRAVHSAIRRNASCSVSGHDRRGNSKQNLRCATESSLHFPQPHAQALLATTAALLIDGSGRSALAEAQATFGSYTPSPYNPGWEIWVGAVAATIPFVIGSWEFGKRILIQRRCQQCEGSGLIQRGRFLKKCPECGGFFPWQGWGRFFTSTATPGNGGVLRAPRGQSSIFYKVPEKQTPANRGQGSREGCDDADLGD